MRKPVAAVVVTYNRRELLLENVEALLGQTKAHLLSVIVVDNHSTDGTKESLMPYIVTDEITYLDTGENLGGAGGFQYGLRYAAEHDFDYVWLMDDDCIPEPDALSAFLDWGRKYDQMGGYGFLSSKVLWTDGSFCKMNVPRRTMTRKLTDYQYNGASLFFASFVSLFVPVPVIREVGLPLKDFFIWTDDWEYTRRIGKKHPGYYIADSVVTHKCETNTGVNIALDRPERLPRYYYLYRNEFYLYKREGIKGILYDIIRKCGHILRILRHAEDHKLLRISYIFRGTFAGFFFHPKVEYPGKGERE